MNFMDFLNEFWYVIIGIAFLFFLFYKYSKNETIGDLTKSKMLMLIIFSIFGLSVIVIQDVFFNEHFFFFLGFFIFIPLITMLIWIILNKNNYYVIESRIQGQEFYRMDLIEENSDTKKDLSKEITIDSGLRIHIMDKEYYESLNHFGNDFSPRYNSGEQIKNCDYFSGKMLYHPELPELKNISFWAKITEFNALKEIVPDLVRRNLELTDFHETKMLMEIDSMAENLPHRLSGINEQIKVYSLTDKIKENIENQIKQSHKGLSESETKESVKNEGGKNDSS